MSISKYILAAVTILGLKSANAQTETELPVNSSLEGTSKAQDWVYYKTDASTQVFGEARVTLRETSNGAGDPDLYVGYKTTDETFVTKDTAKWSDLSQDPDHFVAIPPSSGETTPQKYSIGVYEHTQVVSQYTVGFDLYDCPNANCGSEDAGTCDAATHECTCKGDYDWTGSGPACNYPLYRDLTIGGEAKSVTIPEFSTSYFHFKPSATSFSEVSVTMSIEGGTAPFSMYATRGHYSQRLPIPTTGGYDRAYVGYATSNSGKIVIPSDLYSESDWVISVVSRYVGFSFKLSTQVHTCPGDCSGKGTCNTETRVCKCDEGYGLEDCSLALKELDFKGFDVTLENYETKYFAFNVSGASATRDIALSIHFEVKDKSYTGVIPLVYVHKSSKETKPGSSKYIFRSPMPATLVQQIQLPVHELSTIGTWMIAVVHHQLSSVDVRISLTRTPHCPNKCSGHGTCSDLAVCVCNSGYIGVDCGIKKETGNVHWTVLAVVVILSVITGMFISHYFIKKDSRPTPEATGVQYAQLDA